MRAVSQPIVTPPPPPPPPKAPTTVTAPDLDELPPPDPVEPKRPAAAPRPVPAPVAAPAKAAPPRPAVAGKPAAAAPARPVQAAPRPAPAGPRPVDLNQLREQVAAWRKFNHFEVLGVPQTASAVEIKAAYIGLAKQHHPDTVSDPALHELRSIKADLTARLNEAYQVLGETQERVKYIAQLQEGGAVDIGPILQAEEDFLRATILVKARKLVEAIDLLDQAILLNPNEPEFHAWRAFARFAMAKDKRPEYEPALAECARVIKASPQCVAAHLFTGQMAKIMGDAAKAERAFREVLSIEPNNIEARRELRLAGKS